MILLLLKATLIFALALAVLPLMKKTSSAVRHLLCAMALAVSLALPLTLLIPAASASFAVAVSATTGRAVAMAPRALFPFLTVWAVVCAARLLRLAIGVIRVARVRHAASELSPGVYEADVSAPVVCGLARPAILLPRGAWTSSWSDAAIRHERADIRRKDLWVAFMAHVACAVYWFHPLVWILSGNLRHEQELACDDAVIRSGLDSAAYAEALVAAARSATSTVLLTGCSMFTPKTLRTRISRLLDTRAPRATSRAALLRTGLIAAAVLIAIGTLKPVIAQDGPVEMGPGVTPPAVLYKVAPAYSEAARKAKINGSVLLKAIVGLDGKAHDIQVVNSLDADLDASAVSAVRQWRFKPGERDREAVEVIAQIEVKFRLL